MDGKKRKRCGYVTGRQKKKLIELITKHPQLISCKITQDFNHKDCQRLWQNISNECNSIPGAKKTWRQWRRTWHDLRSKAKKKQADTNGEVPTSAIILTMAEQEALLGIKHIGDNYTSSQDTTEFVHIDQVNDPESHFNNESESLASHRSDSPMETKVFTSRRKVTKLKNNTESKHGSLSNDCYFNCDVLAEQEHRKIQIKEDYLNFKKDYLRQKLNLLKQQTEALKSIAKELSK